YGLNGAGKTNLIEAIYLLSLTKSFRSSNDKILMKKGTKKTIVEGEIRKRNDTSKYRIELKSDGKKVEINDTKIDKISDYVSKINIILFNPTDTNIISDAPSERRKMLNIEISGLNREYLVILSNYNRLLKQRNFYIRQLYINGNASTAYLDILTKKLIEYGCMINKYRQEFCVNINKYIGEIYKKIFGSGELKIKYVSTYNNKSEEELAKMYQKYYQKELAIGKTLLGVHHDDLVFNLDGSNIKELGSQGQRKNSIIAFKLAELNVIHDSKDYYPILILDDLFSELDQEKINNIFGMLNKEVQTFITTTEIDKVKKELIENSKMIQINDGVLEEEV
ncbi:MAG: DNA replication and repair protein RecF, partial [Bacilli bacterium]|nr:DNA replication and repair protein RecF [Bacilli bacterium]